MIAEAIYDATCGDCELADVEAAMVLRDLPLRGFTIVPTALVEEAADLIDSIRSDEPCWFDQHGGCQEHGYLGLRHGERCPQGQAPETVARLRSYCVPADGSGKGDVREL